MRRAMSVCVAVAAGGLCWASVASAAVTPGWECVPAAAGGAVVSGGTGSTPSCAGDSTAVLAPTYVSSGVGGQADGGVLDGQRAGGVRVGVHEWNGQRRGQPGRRLRGERKQPSADGVKRSGRRVQ